MKSGWRMKIFDSNGDEWFHGTVTSFPLSDELVVKKSIEFFNDDAPCFIHRSAVMKRLYLELEEYIAGKCSNNIHSNVDMIKDEIPPHILLIIGNSYKIEKIRCYR